MQRTVTLFFAASNSYTFNAPYRLLSTPIIKISNATFYRRHPASRPPPGQETFPNPPLFPDLTLSLPSFASPNQHWAILSPSSTIRTAFLQILRGQLLCFPPTARSYPYLISDEIARKNPKLRFPERALEYVGFDAERKAFGGAYLSARYESRVEETDFSLAQYLTGITGLNVGEEYVKNRLPDQDVMLQVVKDLELEPYFHRPVSTLSNGQSRRARIGKALLSKPEMLLLDAPFIGLDPFVSKHISEVLHRLAEANAPRVVLSLRPQDAIPGWVTHIVYAGESGHVDALGPKREVFQYLKNQYEMVESNLEKGKKAESIRLGKHTEIDTKLVEMREVGRHLSERGDFDVAGEEEQPVSFSPVLLSRDAYEKIDKFQAHLGDPVVEMEGVRVKYGNNSVLGDWQQCVDGSVKDGLWWNVRRGQRWGIFGANGSGKTTLLSLITSDHPQTYSAPIRIFERSRLPSPGVPGISIFDIQARMGHSSPEVHALFPKDLTVRCTMESAWGDTPLTKPKLNTEATQRIDACLRWFEAELNTLHQETELPNETTQPNLEWATRCNFGELSFSAQRVLLFLRATIRNPDIVILDEAFSGMDDLVRDKCLLFLSRGESMTLHYHDTGPKPVESNLARQGQVAVPGLQNHQALLCVSHSRQEVPGCIREWICLPEPGSGPPRIGRFDGPVELSYRRWNEIWNWPGRKP
ncbi:P-loop containing nucleoside triphosphate hydrolase protein [Lepidopterella palustris CBS 459.81]|uniref:P-loop containing nucleoside triphosphate hydrolase protein n=1 Tax=Lepidopterella palustris CBS 459.81 TaxID=1314670 RepID=A0A8E2E7Y1_9PEZI|nr:P-loop containing nucleoside triphosphate hydrolase protein [Lepidopterella palustris CBS 459.81]